MAAAGQWQQLASGSSWPVAACVTGGGSRVTDRAGQSTVPQNARRAPSHVVADSGSDSTSGSSDDIDDAGYGNRSKGNDSDGVSDDSSKRVATSTATASATAATTMVIVNEEDNDDREDDGDDEGKCDVDSGMRHRLRRRQ